jgi:hypothetical protein
MGTTLALVQAPGSQDNPVDLFEIQNINTSVPAIISNAPSVVFKVSGSPRNTTASTMAIATLILSTGTTCDTFPSCSALK